MAEGEKPCALNLCRLQPAEGQPRDLPYRDAPIFEQWVAVFTGFFVKPLYMLLSLLVVAALWRERSADLAALRWAMIFKYVFGGLSRRPQKILAKTTQGGVFFR